MKFTVFVLIMLSLVSAFGHRILPGTTRNLASATEASGGLSPFVIGGDPVTDPTRYPFHVRIFLNKVYHCGGVLTIGFPFEVVTAGHCVPQHSKTQVKGGKYDLELTVVAGCLDPNPFATLDHNCQIRRVFLANVHPLFSIDTRRHDIAKLVLSEPFNYNWYNSISGSKSTIAPIEMQLIPSLIDEDSCKVIGWGCTVPTPSNDTDCMDSDQLLSVDMKLVPLSRCEGVNPNFQGQICAEGEEGSGPFKGDSGGSLFCSLKSPYPQYPYLVGIVSFGPEDDKGPTVFTDVIYYKNWLEGVDDSSMGMSVFVVIIAILIALGIVLSLAFVFYMRKEHHGHLIQWHRDGDTSVLT